jgi:hypothetical protein
MTTAAVLIENGARTARLVPDQQPMLPVYSERGLVILNNILDKFGGAHVTIPYESIVNFTLNPAQESYISSPSGPDIVGNQIIDISDMWATQSNVRYPLVDINNKMYRNICYPLSQGIPAMYVLRVFQSTSQIIVQPLPSQTMTATLVCKQRLSNVVLTDNMDQIPPQWFLCLQYLIAKYFRQYYALPVIPEFDQEIQSLMKDLMAENTIDVYVEKTEILTRNRFYYPYILGFF